MRTVILLCASLLALLQPVALSARPAIDNANCSLALRAGGAVLAWGDNEYGQLGDGTTTNRSTPARISGLTAVAAISCGRFHSLALKSDGSVWAWGSDVTTISRTSPPVQVIGLTSVVAISANGHSLALKSDGSIWAWGANDTGELGDGTTISRSTPVQVSGLTSVVAIAAGFYHSVALKSDGSVWAWGYNFDGQLGDGTNITRTTPVQVAGLTGVVAISAGWGHTVALKNDGSVWAWGYNAFGQLGDATTISRSTPRQAIGSTGVVAISAGSWYSMALKSDGTVWAWGQNYGQLGDGSTTNRSTAVQVVGLTRVAGISGGEFHSLALKSDGTVWAWGSNSRGEIGDGTNTQRSTPVQVLGENGAGFLNLNTTGIVVPIPPPPNPPFQATTTTTSDPTGLTITTTAQFPPQDEGKQAYVFGYAPASLLGLFFKDGPACVLVKVTPTGLQVLLNGASGLTPYINNIEKGKDHSILVLKSVPAAQVAGTTFCIGVGNSPTQATSPGNYVCVVGVFNAESKACEAPASTPAVAAPTCTLTASSGSISAGGSSTLTATCSPAATTYAWTGGSCAGTTSASCTVSPAASTTYTVSGSNTGGSGNTASATVTVNVASLVSYEGLWIKPDEGGWGVNITHQGAIIFATWFTYDTDGTGMWLVMSNGYESSPRNFGGSLYRTTGPAFNANPFAPINQSNYTAVGTLNFTFVDANNGTMSYTVNGVSQTKAIKRFLFAATGTTCTLGGAQASPSNYQDLWLRAADGSQEGGWGINIAHQGDTLFATWFTYLPGTGTSNKGMWLVMSNGAKISNRVYSGRLYRTTGPPFSQVPFTPIGPSNYTDVGLGTFTFTDDYNGTFSYTVNGVSGSKPIARFFYALPNTVCR